MSKTYKVQYIMDGQVKTHNSAGKGFLTVVLRWFKAGIIHDLQFKHKQPITKNQNAK